jgi:hypothetical protein
MELSVETLRHRGVGLNHSCGPVSFTVRADLRCSQAISKTRPGGGGSPAMRSSSMCCWAGNTERSQISGGFFWAHDGSRFSPMPGEVPCTEPKMEPDGEPLSDVQ